MVNHQDKRNGLEEATLPYLVGAVEGQVVLGLICP
jgi:hypothetical protein